jgi:hypothetical protein
LRRRPKYDDFNRMEFALIRMAGVIMTFGQAWETEPEDTALLLGLDDAFILRLCGGTNRTFDLLWGPTPPATMLP